VTSRTYDVVLTVANALPFQTGNVVIGNTSAAVGIIAGIDRANNLLKVKLANAISEFTGSENIYSKVITISGTANGAINDSTYLPFQANVMSGNVVTAVTNIINIQPSTFIAEKNAFTQNPIVRLYSVYYPGEWYPPNEAGNPGETGEGRAWSPYFPIRFAEIVGDLADDISYNVSYGGTTYSPYPVSISGIEQASDGRVNELTLTLFNVDNMISRLVEDPFLSGNNTTNSVVAHVNGELVHGLDPRTVSLTLPQAATISQECLDTLTRARANGLAYSGDIVNLYGMNNASFTYEQTKAVSGTWEAYKEDSRDLLGGIVNIKTTFANFLDFWPEYSLITAITANAISVKNSLPYRLGDNVKSIKGSEQATIQHISDDHIIYLSNEINSSTAVGDALYIVNEDADAESYIEDRFKIDQLESLSDHVASFALVSWLQYFKVIVPKRKFYKNTCQWVYKGPECQYPGPGNLAIPGTNLTSNTNPIGLDNQVASIKSPSIINMSSWIAGTAGSATGYTQNGDGNSRIVDSTPYGELQTVWDVSNQDAGASDGDGTAPDGGWNGSLFPITNSSLYRFSVWIRRKTIGNGSTYLGLNGYNSVGSNIGVLIRGTGATSTNPYFYAASWPYAASEWMLLVGHVWPVGSGTGAAHVDTGIYRTNGTKVANMTDFVWQTLNTQALHRSYLYYSSDTSTNQQFYDPRVDIVNGSQPSIADLISYSPSALANKSGSDVCAKSLAACTVRNNSIHFGGFPGVGRTIPRA
jgi:phage-related protein